MKNKVCIKVPTRCTVCFQFITINNLYMFRALICLSSEGTVCTTGIFFAEIIILYYIYNKPTNALF
jgi:hypothetical protein